MGVAGQSRRPCAVCDRGAPVPARVPALWVLTRSSYPRHPHRHTQGVPGADLSQLQHAMSFCKTSICSCLCFSFFSSSQHSRRPLVPKALTATMQERAEQVLFPSPSPATKRRSREGKQGAEWSPALWVSNYGASCHSLLS